MVDNITEATGTYRFCDPNELNDLTVIHYGSTQYRPELVEPIQDNNNTKPDGGLWTSPINSTWGWKDWCHMTNFRRTSERESFKLRFHPGTKITIIRSLRDLNLLPGGPCRHFPLEREYPRFDIISKHCDAIWLTVYGQGVTRHSHPRTLYGWDCETVFIMNPNCCFQV